MLAFETEDVLQAWALPMENIIVVGGFVLALATDVVGHGSSETIRPSDVSVTPFESASEQWAGGDAAAGGWLAAMRAMAIEYQLATDASGNGLLL